MWALAVVSLSYHPQNQRLLLTLPVKIFMTIFQCKPVSGFWNRTKPAICNVDSRKFFIGNAIPNILTDVALMVLPLPYIWQLNRSKSQKIALAGVFLLGGL